MRKRPIFRALLWAALGLLASALAFADYHQLWPHQQLADDHRSRWRRYPCFPAAEHSKAEQYDERYCELGGNRLERWI